MRGEWSKSPCARRQRDAGVGGGRGQALAALAPNTRFTPFELVDGKSQHRGQSSASPVFLTATYHRRRQHAFLSSYAEG